VGVDKLAVISWIVKSVRGEGSIYNEGSDRSGDSLKGKLLRGSKGRLRGVKS